MREIVVTGLATPDMGSVTAVQMPVWAVLIGAMLMVALAYVLYRHAMGRGRKQQEETIARMEREHKKDMEDLNQRMQQYVYMLSMVTKGDDKQTSAPTPLTETKVDDSNAASFADQQLDVDDLDDEARAANHPFTMLMVDDSADMCRFVRDYFRGEYNVITAANGQQAVRCLEENDNVDLVVSDVKMPKMNGLELCKTIKSDLRWSHIPVILLTGHTGEELEMEGLKMGADDYITKPFNVEMLRLRVKNLIEKKENRQRQFREDVDVAASDITITSVDEQFIQKAMKICEEHLSDTEFSVEALGHELSLSRTYLYKKLINITGKGPAEFIRTIRMKRGKQLLETTPKQIAEIAVELGFSSPKRFTENFKAEYGMSPSEYVRKLRTERNVNG